MPFIPGTLDAFGGSMAEAIETVFEQLWQDRYGDPLPPEGRDDRRMLYVSIAQGVVNHLQARAADGFAVEVVQDATNQVRSTGTAGVIPVQVQQTPGTTNRVRGTGTVQVLT